MPELPLHAVTGAFGYSGRAIAERLLAAGCRARTLTNSPIRPQPLACRVDVLPLSFDDPAALTKSLQGAGVLYNTYWVRFNYKTFTHAQAVRNTRALFEAAKAAGVQRIVHVSITNPSEESPLEYFRGKAELEKTLKELGVSYAILRPAVLFGRQDILINNIAWMLRHLPFFGVFGDGEYRLQPIHVDDLANLAVAQGQNHEDVTIDAIGPETFTYRELVKTIAAAIGKPRPIVSVPPAMGFLIGRMLGWVMHDVVITKEEIHGLMANLLCTDSAPAGRTKISEWAREYAEELGRSYASELARRC